MHEYQALMIIKLTTFQEHGCNDYTEKYTQDKLLVYHGNVVTVGEDVFLQQLQCAILWKILGRF